MNKKTIKMRVAVHPVKAALWNKRRKMSPEMSLRERGRLVGEKRPQVLKHHLEQMVKMGSIDYIGGLYVFPKD